MRLLPAAVCFLLVVDRATAGKDRTVSSRSSLEGCLIDDALSLPLAVICDLFKVLVVTVDFLLISPLLLVQPVGSNAASNRSTQHNA